MKASQNGAAGQDDIGTFGIQPRHPAAFLQRHSTEHLHDFAKMCCRQHVVALQPPLGEAACGNVGEVLDGAGTAEREIDVVPSYFPQGVHGVALHIAQDAAVFARRYHPWAPAGNCALRRMAPSLRELR